MKRFGRFSATRRFGKFWLVRRCGRLFGANLCLRLRPVCQASTLWPPVLLPQRISTLANSLFSLLRHPPAPILSGNLHPAELRCCWRIVRDAANSFEICRIPQRDRPKIVLVEKYRVRESRALLSPKQLPSPGQTGMSGRCLPGRPRRDTDTTLKGCRMSGCPAHLRPAQRTQRLQRQRVRLRQSFFLPLMTWNRPSW